MNHQSESTKEQSTAVGEETHLLIASRSTSIKRSEIIKDNARCILLSTTASRFGSRTWEFATPLLLLEWSPGSLAVPAALGLACALFRTLVSPMLGRLADRNWDRMSTVWVGTTMQASGCILSVVALFWRNALSSTSMNKIISLLLVIQAGVIESLGAQLASVAVKKEWLPIVFEETNAAHDRGHEREPQTKQILDILLPRTIKLSFMNTTMTNIDLMAAMFGPVLAGWILEIFARDYSSTQCGFATIATINAISFLPEILLLRRVYLSCPALQDKEQSSTNFGNDANMHMQQNPWKIWYNHPSGLPLLTISLASLYMTALSPAGVVLTAYLVTIGLSPTNIGLFRGFGALFGVVGISLFSSIRKCDGTDDLTADDEVVRSAYVQSIDHLRRVSLTFLLLEVVSVLVAALIFSTEDMATTLKPPNDKQLNWQIIVFLTAIVISRAGLYSFDVGVLEIEQYVVDERYRNAVGSVEGALCSLAEMGMYILSIALPNPTQFGWQVGISATFVSVGTISFGTFLCMYHMHLHHHCENEAICHNHSHEHSHNNHQHTLQQEKELNDGYHIHLHRHNAYLKYS